MKDDIKFTAVVNVEFKGLDQVAAAPETVPVLRMNIPLCIGRDTVSSSTIETLFLESAPPLTAEILAGLFPHLGLLLQDIANGRKPDLTREVAPEDLPTVFKCHTIQ